jgi:quercetin dioxygenase-like cupin family protein
MQPLKSFRVFGEHVDLLVSGETTGGTHSVLQQRSSPGGGPPPHIHEHEDETFIVIEGAYEVLSEGAWHRLERGDVAFGPRGKTHAFRNAGSTPGVMMVIATPSGIESYLEQISEPSCAGDIPAVLRISEQYGIHFPRPAQAVEAHAEKLPAPTP